MSDTYKAIKNFFHNTQKLDRQTLKEIVREVITPIVKDEIKRFLETVAARVILENALKQNLYYITKDVGSTILNILLTDKLKYDPAFKKS